MVEYANEESLTELLKAVSDPTRRSLLTLLCQEGPYRVTDLAGPYAMSLNAISNASGRESNAAYGKIPCVGASCQVGVLLGVSCVLTRQRRHTDSRQVYR